jgi:ATP-binding cassette, sub-family E, member 1
MANEIKVNDKMFIGDELYKYMCMLHNNNLSIAYKTQEISKYHKLTDKVCDYISNNKLEIDKYIDKLYLRHLLGRQLNQLFGGELQRLLIAITCATNADSYIFDEPSAFFGYKTTHNYI